jgi:CheY-like chemotaxis protein
MFNCDPMRFETNSKRRVLVVDDEAAIRDCVCALVSMLGFQVVQARDGGEALDKFERFNGTICLVIMDISMPVLDGVQAMNKIRKIDPRAKIILCSGNPEAELVQSGADGIIAKPFRGQTIVTAVEQALKATG